jgi:DNA-3-methyladenine glycosylase
MKLPLSFYEREDVLQICRDLLGKYLMTDIDGKVTGGLITEAEAYTSQDKACHAFGNKRTNRTQIMFGEGGHAYVYLCYGLHQMFNIVTNREGEANAILIRAIEPKIGIDTMLERRNMDKVLPRIAAGPGSVCKALGIRREHYGLPLDGDTIWIEDRKVIVPDKDIVQSPRVGVDYAGEDAFLPWRFRIKGSIWTSLPK